MISHEMCHTITKQVKMIDKQPKNEAELERKADSQHEISLEKKQTCSKVLDHETNLVTKLDIQREISLAKKQPKTHT